MADQPNPERHQIISAAAYAMLAQHGYGGASMLRIARHAKASNETLYRWYGDKDGLFAAMIRDNARQAKQMLDDALSAQTDPHVALAQIAPVLLEMLLGERAILLNRAAAADPSGVLGSAIAQGGRGTLKPLFTRLMQPICAAGPHNPQQATEWFLALLIGDLQIRRVLQEIPAPTRAQIERRCETALATFARLMG